MSMFVTLEAADDRRGRRCAVSQRGAKARALMPLKNQFYGMREFAVEDPDGYVMIFAQRTA